MRPRKLQTFHQLHLNHLGQIRHMKCLRSSHRLKILSVAETILSEEDTSHPYQWMKSQCHHPQSQPRHLSQPIFQLISLQQHLQAQLRQDRHHLSKTHRFSIRQPFQQSVPQSQHHYQHSMVTSHKATVTATLCQTTKLLQRHRSMQDGLFRHSISRTLRLQSGSLEPLCRSLVLGNSPWMERAGMEVA